MKFLLHNLLFLLFCVSCPAATGDVIIDVLGASGRRVAVTVPKTNDYFIGFDGSGNLVAKEGAAPSVAIGSIAGLGTGVATALAVNVGTEGAPVINGGALGTPASATLTNANGLPWAGVLKNGSSLADLATRSASDLNSGVLPAARLPLPTTSTVGGVMRNTGAAGQYVVGIAGNGLLLYDTPQSAVWGHINGDLSDQTDLQTALDAKLATNGDGSALTGITAAQVGAVANGDSPTFDQITLTNGIVESPSGALSYNYYDTVNSTAAPLVVVTLYDDQTPPQSIGASIFGFRGDGAGSGTQFFQGSTNNFHFEGVGGSNTATVYAAEFNGSGASLTNLDASNLTSGTLAVAYGGSGRPSFSANSVLLGNGTSPLNEVLPGTTGNVLTSNGTTWTSTAPAVRNPAGSGSELQFRSSGTAFGAVTNSSVSGGALTLGNAEALGVTSSAYLTLRNTTAATSGNQQVSPSIVREGRGFATTGGTSQIVRFRDNVLPVQGSTNPSVTWRLQSEINDSGTWTDRLTLDSTGLVTASQYRLSGNINSGMDLRDAGSGAVGILAGGARVIDMRSGAISIGTNSLTWSTSPISAADISLERDAAGILAQRNSTNAQIFRVYETDSGANDEYLELSAASGTNLIRPQATGTGTASVVRYFTTTTVWYGSGNGSPEGVHIAGIGSVYTDTANGTLYRKTSGTGSTGWVTP